MHRRRSRQPRSRRIHVMAVIALASTLVGFGWMIDDHLPSPISVRPESPAPPPRTKGIAATFEDQVMEIVNQERWTHGSLAPLKRVDLLDSAAETHTSNMATRNFHMHCDPDTGTLPGDRMTAAGYIPSSGSENIAAGYSTPSIVMAAWMASPGHMANILSTTSREIGIGYVYQAGDQANVRESVNGLCPATSSNRGPYGHYWTQVFGSRSGVYPVVIDREAYETATTSVDLYLYGTGTATSMRIRNQGGSWTAWQTFAANVAWQLAPVTTTAGVDVEISTGLNGSGTVYSASDTIVYTGSLDIIFIDGFESGMTTSWDSTTP